LRSALQLPTGQAHTESYSLTLRLKALLHDAFAGLLENQAPASLSPDALFLAPVLAYIDHHLGETLTVRELAAQCGFSESHFARLFRQQVGETVMEYVRERRIHRAAQELLFTDDNLDLISERCGFGNRHYLTRLFSRLVGVAPATYRRTARG